MDADEARARGFRKARADFTWFCRTFLKIKNKDGVVVPLEVNPAQQIIVDAALTAEAEGKPVRIIGLKGRQQGFSTIVQAWLAWKVFLRKGQNALVIAHDLEPASQLFGKIELMYDYLPEDLRPPKAAGVRQGRKIVLDKPFHGLIYVETSQNRDAGRSGTFQHAHCTELPYWEDAKSTMDGLLQSIPSKPATSIFLESTAGGMGDYFHDLWQRSKRGETEFQAVFVPWFKTPEYARERNELDAPLDERERELQKTYSLSDEQLLWYRDKRAVLGDDTLAQEYPCCDDEAFRSSGLPFFRMNDLAWYRKTMIRPPLKRGRFIVEAGRARLVDEHDGPWWLWKLPVKGHRYCVFSDPSSGMARDYAACHVLDVDELEVVATYRAKVVPEDLASEMSRIGLAFNTALVSPETNNHGEVVMYRLTKGIGYPNLYIHEDDASVSGSERAEYGWRTTTRTRPLMLGKLAELIHGRELKLYCSRTLRELETFVYKDEAAKKAEAQKNAYDDMVMSLAGAVAIRGRTPHKLKFSVVTSDDTVSAAVGY